MTIFASLTGRPARDDSLVELKPLKRRYAKFTEPRFNCQWSSRLRLLLLAFLSLDLIADFLNQNLRSHRSHKVASPAAPTERWALGVLQAVALVAAADSYSDASAETPSVESALEDDDEDDEELGASASNEYPDGDNDNDESYEDADDDRQESRRSEKWIAPAQVDDQMDNGEKEALALRSVHGRFRPIVRNATMAH